MKEVRNNYDILKKLELDLPPVGVKFSFFRPESRKRCSSIVV